MHLDKCEMREMLSCDKDNTLDLSIWLRNRYLPYLITKFNCSKVRKCLGLYQGERIPENERNLTDVRNRVSLLIEHDLAALSNEILEEYDIDDMFWCYVVANRFPDLEIRKNNGERCMRIEVKCLQSMAEEKSANFDTLIKDINPQTDFVVVFLWEWDYKKIPILTGIEFHKFWTDKLPKGKKPCLSLRELEKQVNTDLDLLVNIVDGQMTVCELVDRYLKTKTGVRQSTKQGYVTVQRLLAKEAFGKKTIRSVKTSDAKLFLIKLQQEDGKSYSSIHTIRGVLRPAFQMAVDDDILVKNPFGFQLAGVLVNDAVIREAITKDQMRKFLKFVHGDVVYCKYYEVV